MGLRDFFRRRNESDIAEPVGMGDEEEYDAAEGGPSIFKAEIAGYRWAAQQEALNVARRGIDPTRWDDARPAFDHERGLAHAHEGLRDRLANYVGQRIREEVRDLYSLAHEVGEARDQLRTIDQDLGVVTADWYAQYSNVCADTTEVGRYYGITSKRSKALRILIIAVLVFSEFIISGAVFENGLQNDTPGLGYIFALGLMTILIVIPHYAAHGLKEGVTRYHQYVYAYLKGLGVKIKPEVERNVHTEDRDDRGFRLLAAILGTLIVSLIIPLSALRSTEVGDGGWTWFFFFLFLQLAISGYFFFREWLDHGSASHKLVHLASNKAELEATRAGVLGDVAAATSDFYAEAEDLVFTVQQAPRWDSYIVESYYETLRFGRHLMAVEQPEMEAFITWARVPYLGRKATAEMSAYPLDASSDEHVSLEDDGPLGREWLQSEQADALRIVVGDDGESATAAWQVRRAPDIILAEVLRRTFDLALTYKRPPALDFPIPTIRARDGGGAEESSDDGAQYQADLHPLSPSREPGRPADAVEAPSGPGTDTPPEPFAPGTSPFPPLPEEGEAAEEAMLPPPPAAGPLSPSVSGSPLVDLLPPSPPSNGQGNGAPSTNGASGGGAPTDADADADADVDVDVRADETEQPAPPG